MLQPIRLTVTVMLLVGTALCAPKCCLGQPHRYLSDICLLDADRDALAARIKLIDAAVCRIDMAYYAVDTGSVSLGLLEAMCQAAQRGVRSRVLVDAMQTDLPPPLTALLQSRGVEVRFYHPIRVTRPRQINRRMHVKLLVADHEAMVIGSRNLQDTHFGLREVNFVDCDLLIGGQICAAAANYFDRLWTSGDVESADSQREGTSLLDSKEIKRNAELTSQQWHARLLHARNDINARLGPCKVPQGECVYDAVAWLVQDRTSDKTTSQMQDQIIGIIDGAKSCMTIETPYPVFSYATLTALRRARDRGVDVVLLTNSLRSTDRVAVYSAYHNDKAKLLRMGVRIYEFDDVDHLHAKTLIVDERLALVGSHNFDSRSDHFNLELCICIADPYAVSSVKQSFTQRLARGKLIESPLDVVDAAGQEARRLQLAVRRWAVNLYRIFL